MYVNAVKTTNKVVTTADHPQVDIKVTFPTVQGGREIRVNGAVADSGAQVNIFPSRLMRDSRLQLSGVTTNKLPQIKTASGTCVPVTGAINVRVSAAATNGERFLTIAKVYIADV